MDGSELAGFLFEYVSTEPRFSLLAVATVLFFVGYLISTVVESKRFSRFNDINVGDCQFLTF